MKSSHKKIHARNKHERKFKPKKTFLSISLTITLLPASSNIILEDNLNPTIDKISHSTTSFGLYYTFRYFGFTKTKSIIISLGTGVIYEVYQIYDPFEEEYFRGISLHDILYNLIGIGSAYFVDEIFKKNEQNSQEDVKSDLKN